MQSVEDKLEIAKQQLIADLENNGMEFLLAAMINDADYSELMEEHRKSKTMYTYSSDESISWWAYRKADDLRTPEDKAELLQLLSDERFSASKDNIYRCLSSICGNTNDKELFNFLIGKVQEEEEEELRVAILSSLEDVIKDEGYNIEPIKILVKEGTADEIHAAVKALANTTDPEVEDLLLDEFKISSTHMKGMICGPLSTVGTLKSIPILKEAYKKSRNGFMRSFVEHAVAKIEARAKAAGNNGI